LDATILKRIEFIMNDLHKAETCCIYI